MHSEMQPIYLDYAATTPVDERVAQAMWPWLMEHFGNPASSHAWGSKARQAVESARHHVAALVGAQPEGVIFTSGATEAINLAIKGRARFAAGGRKHLVTLATEHQAVLASCRALQREGYRVIHAPLLPTGEIDMDAMKVLLDERVLLLSVAHVNGELGIIHPIAQLADWCHQRDIAFHVDAAQSLGKLPMDMSALGIDYLSFSGHKIYGPKGAGGLVVRRQPGPGLQPLLDGGGQEGGLRGGTLATHQIVGLGEAARLALQALPDEPLRLASWRERMWSILSSQPDVTRHGSLQHTAPHILSVALLGIDASSLLYAIPQLALSRGSACANFHGGTSHVMRALGMAPEVMRATVRLSFGRPTTSDEVEQGACWLVEALQWLRTRSPAPQGKAKTYQTMPVAQHPTRSLEWQPIGEGDQLSRGQGTSPGAMNEYFFSDDHVAWVFESTMAQGEAGSVQEGRVRFGLTVNGQDQVMQVGYQAEGPPELLAAASLLAEQVEGLPLEALAGLLGTAWHAPLGLTGQQVYMAFLAEEALHRAWDAVEERQDNPGAVSHLGQDMIRYRSRG
jgi:cysteine desulfurase